MEAKEIDRSVRSVVFIKDGVIVSDQIRLYPNGQVVCHKTMIELAEKLGLSDYTHYLWPHFYTEGTPFYVGGDKAFKTICTFNEYLKITQTGQMELVELNAIKL